MAVKRIKSEFYDVNVGTAAGRRLNEWLSLLTRQTSCSLRSSPRPPRLSFPSLVIARIPAGQWVVAISRLALATPMLISWRQNFTRLTREARRFLSRARFRNLHRWLWNILSALMNDDEREKERGVSFVIDHVFDKSAINRFPSTHRRSRRNVAAIFILFFPIARIDTFVGKCFV